MGVLLNAPFSWSHCQTAHAVKHVRFRSTSQSLSEIYTAVIFSYQVLHSSYQVLSQIAFQNFKWRSRLKARQPKYLFSPDTQHAYLSEGARCGGSVREASPVEERRAEFADSDLEPDGTARRTAAPGKSTSPRGKRRLAKKSFFAGG
jgi:hypothetical protein